MEELNAIRKDLSFGCEVIITYKTLQHKEMGWDDYEIMASVDEKFICITKDYFMDLYWEVYHLNRMGSDDIPWDITEIIWHPPVLSDCIRAIELKNKDDDISLSVGIASIWNTNFPFLKEQSDRLWSILLTKLTND